jgi:hypothetical protein
VGGKKLTLFPSLSKLIWGEGAMKTLSVENYKRFLPRQKFAADLLPFVLQSL